VAHTATLQALDRQRCPKPADPPLPRPAFGALSPVLARARALGRHLGVPPRAPDAGGRHSTSGIPPLRIHTGSSRRTSGSPPRRQCAGRGQPALPGHGAFQRAPRTSIPVTVTVKAFGQGRGHLRWIRPPTADRHPFGDLGGGTLVVVQPRWSG
jgi:hypothetical protein